jgi:hypothetical protein
MILIWILIVVAVAAWVTAFWAATHPEIVGRGQDAAGKGMAAGCLGILFGFLGTVCAVIAGVLGYVWWENLDGVTRVSSFVPATVIAIGAMVTWGMAKNAKARRGIQTRKQERQSEAVVNLVHAEPELSRIFQALQKVQPTRWQQLWQSPEHFRWQFTNYVYRAALNSIHITPEIAKDPELEIVLGMFEREEAVGAILLYGPDESAIAPIVSRLRKTKWPVGSVIISGEDWIERQWLPRALEMAGPDPRGE